MNDVLSFLEYKRPFFVCLFGQKINFFFLLLSLYKLDFLFLFPAFCIWEIYAGCRSVSSRRLSPFFQQKTQTLPTSVWRKFTGFLTTKKAKREMEGKDVKRSWRLIQWKRERNFLSLRFLHFPFIYIRNKWKDCGNYLRVLQPQPFFSFTYRIKLGERLSEIP